MAIFFLIFRNEIRSIIDTEDQAVVAVPLLGGADGVSLVSKEHLGALALDLRVPEETVIAKMGVIDKREATAIEATLK